MLKECKDYPSVAAAKAAGAATLIAFAIFC